MSEGLNAYSNPLKLRFIFKDSGETIESDLERGFRVDLDIGAIYFYRHGEECRFNFNEFRKLQIWRQSSGEWVDLPL